ncbi:MAG: hypothetical protein JO372_20540 [Solirubrobacterales bacterium]|nr:hypothetical protein [Solirubrobacterales bacterium]
MPDDATAVELALAELVDVLELLELLPHAATTQPVRSTATATGARRLQMSLMVMVRVLSGF